MAGKQSHSVAQSSFDDPCQPLQSGNVPGFWSGMMPVTAESTSMPVFSIMVNDTRPIWFYCATAKHCQNGMSGVINPYVPAQERKGKANKGNRPEGKTLEEYKVAAASVEKTGVPEGIEGGKNGTDFRNNGTSPSPTGGSGGGSGSSAPTYSSPLPSQTEADPAETGAPGAAAAVGIPPGKAIAALAAVVVGALVLI